MLWPWSGHAKQHPRLLDGIKARATLSRQAQPTSGLSAPPSTSAFGAPTCWIAEMNARHCVGMAFQKSKVAWKLSTRWMGGVTIPPVEEQSGTDGQDLCSSSIQPVLHDPSYRQAHSTDVIRRSIILLATKPYQSVASKPYKCVASKAYLSLWSSGHCKATGDWHAPVWRPARYCTAAPHVTLSRRTSSRTSSAVLGRRRPALAAHGRTLSWRAVAAWRPARRS
eukprot:366567-Chlamydomonas_euryale.AAC.1